jgi:hypothetical protein
MNAQELINDLDRALADGGEPVTLRRAYVESDGESESEFNVTIQGKVRRLQPQEIIDEHGAIVQDSLVVISPTGLIAASWPFPPVKDDRIFLGDGIDPADADSGNIWIVTEERWQGQVVRYTLHCRF